MPVDFAVSTAFKAIDKTSKVLKTIQGNAGKVTRRISGMFSKLERKTAIFGSRFQSAFKTGIAVAGIATLTLAMQQGIRTGLDFEQTLVNAAAKFGPAARPGTEAFKNLEKAAKDVGATTEFTASQAAQGLNFLALAGFNAQQSIAALPQVVDLATAAQVDLATASDIATDTLGAMGLMTKNTAQLTLNLARVNDVLAKTTTTANTNMTQLFEAITEGGPVATSAGASIEQFAALAGKLADAGIKGSRAGTTLKNVFVRLSAPTNQAAKAIAKLGIQTKDARGNLRDVTKILDDINTTTAKLGTAEKAEVLNAIFGKIPIAGVNILLNQGGQALRDYTRTLESAAGASQDMAAVMRATTSAAVKTLQSAIEGLGLVIFKQIQPAFTAAVKGLTKFVGGWAQFLKMHPGLIGFLVALAKIAVPVIAVTGAIIGLNVAIAAFNLLMAANPIGLIVIGIAAAIAAIVVFRKQIIAVGAVIIGVLLTPLMSVLKLLSLIPGLGILGQAVDVVAGGLRGAIAEGFGGGDVETPAVATARQISETKQTSTNRVIIEDGTGRARRAEDDGTGVVELISRNAGLDEEFAGA